MGVLDGQKEAAQLKVSIFINFKVFHTPHPFSFNNPVPQSHRVFIFSDFNWASMEVTLSEGNYTPLHK